MPVSGRMILPDSGRELMAASWLRGACEIDCVIARTVENKCHSLPYLPGTFVEEQKDTY